MVGGGSTLDLDKRNSSVIVHILEILSVFVCRLDKLGVAECQRSTSPNAHAGRRHGNIEGTRAPARPLLRSVCYLEKMFRDLIYTPPSHQRLWLKRRSRVVRWTARRWVGRVWGGGCVGRWGSVVSAGEGVGLCSVGCDLVWVLGGWKFVCSG